MRLVLTVGICLLAAQAEAGRWKIGTGPQQCKTATGGNCYWGSDTGSNQCTCATTTAPTTATLRTTKGELIFTNIDDGDGNPLTKAGVVTARNYGTKEAVTFRVRLQTSAYDPIDVRHLSSSIKGMDYTDLTQIPGNTTHPTIYRNEATNTWQTPAPLPGAPGGGATCAVAYQIYTNHQLGCFGASVGQTLAYSFQRSLIPVFGAGLSCLKSGSLVAYALCVAAASGITFTTTTLTEIFYGTQPNTSYACNAVAQARVVMSAACNH